MRSTPHLQRFLAATLTALVFLGLLIPGLYRQAPNPVQAQDGGGDWVMFGGDHSRNMVNNKAKNLPVKWEIDDDALWSAGLGSRAYGGPVVAKGKIFIGTNNQALRDKKYFDPVRKEPIDLGVLMTFKDGSGEFLRQTVYTKLKSGLVNDWPLEGICSTPAVEGDRLYYVSNRCELVCDEIETGKNVWKLDMIKELSVFPHNLAVGCPLIVGDDIFVVTANGVDEDHINVPAPKAPSFIKVAKKDGKVLWQDNSPSIKLTETTKKGTAKDFFKSLVNKGELIQHGQWSNPAYAVVNGQPQVVFPGGNGVIYSFNPKDGKLIWSFDCNPKDSEYELLGKGTRSDFIGTPVIYKDRVYIGVGQDPEHETGVGHFWCIDMTKQGDVSPELVVDGNVWPPKTKANPNSAKVWHFGGALDAKDKGKLGRNYYFGRTMSTAAIKDDLVYIAELAGYLHCLDANTGASYWNHNVKANIWSSAYLADNKVYLGTDNSEVFVFAHGKEKKVLATNEMPQPIRATPVAANNTLYIISGNKLFALGKKN